MPTIIVILAALVVTLVRLVLLEELILVTNTAVQRLMVHQVLVGHQEVQQQPMAKLVRHYQATQDKFLKGY
jgi:hypothetical protein